MVTDLVADGLGKKIRAVLDEPETGPTLRRFFVNTMFDSTFVILGILIASAFSSEPSLRTVIVTIVTSSVALGISTGISVMEAETMEQSIKMREMERAMLTSLEDTHLHRISRYTIFLVAAVNFCAPIIAGSVTLSPFLLGESNIQLAAYISLGLAITILSWSGGDGPRGEAKPLGQGSRMAVAGVGAFILLLHRIYAVISRCGDGSPTGGSGCACRPTVRRTTRSYFLVALPTMAAFFPSGFPQQLEDVLGHIRTQPMTTLPRSLCSSDQPKARRRSSPDRISVPRLSISMPTPDLEDHRWIVGKASRVGSFMLTAPRVSARPRSGGSAARCRS